MEKSKITAIKSQFDDTIHILDDTDVEYWLARELMPLLGYERWENFEKAIARSMESCQTSETPVSDHFREVTKMVQLGSGAKRSVKDYMLTRYACYLIAQNGDPKKEEIAFAQSYFAVQTRKQELIEERIAYIERTEARGRLRESKNGCRRISMSAALTMPDSEGFAPRAIRRCLAVTPRRT